MSVDATTGALAKVDDADLASISTIEDALALLASQGIAATDITDLGDGFSVMDKAEFINVPLVILDYKIANSKEYTDEKGDPLPFAIVRLVTSDGRKAIITDGSSGIARQVKDFHTRGVFGGIMVRKGLAVSKYDYVDEKGKRTPATTYYFGM